MEQRRGCSDSIRNLRNVEKTAIVILNWNGERMLDRFLPSVLLHSGEASVVVADNASTDGSLALMAEKFPNVRTIELDRNYGFAEGYNKALSQVEAEYYLLLNSDVEVRAGWLDAMLTYMDSHPEATACQPKMLSQANPCMLEYAGACGGYIDKLGYPFCRGRILGTVEADCGLYDTVAHVVWASGAALLIRSRVYWEVGGLDGSFFAHQEEIDLCWRMRSRGYDIVCVPESRVYHVGGGTLPPDSPRKTYLNFRNNLLLLYKNLPDEDFRRVMRWRLWLDALASLQYVLKGKWGSFLAVWKARKDFHAMRHIYNNVRRNNLALSKIAPSDILTPKSILWQYYVCGKKTYQRLLGS